MVINGENVRNWAMPIVRHDPGIHLERIRKTIKISISPDGNLANIQTMYLCTIYMTYYNHMRCEFYSSFNCTTTFYFRIAKNRKTCSSRNTLI